MYVNIVVAVTERLIILNLKYAVKKVEQLYQKIKILRAVELQKIHT